MATITDKSIRAAASNVVLTGKEIIIWDDSPRGFFVRVGSRNTKFPTSKITFGVRKRQGGRDTKPIKVMFGVYPDMTISAARDQALALVAQIRNGENPSRQKKDLFALRRKEYQAYKTNKFSTIFESYRQKRLEGNNKDTNYFEKEMPNLFNRYVIPTFGNRAFGEIQRDDIKSLLKSIPTLPVRRKVEAMLKPLFKYALGEDIIKHDVFLGIEPTPKSEPRDRVLSKAELRAFWLATGDIIATDKPVFGYYFRALLLSAARLREVSNLEFGEIDFDDEKITIPANRMKMNKPHIIPVVSLLAETLKATPRKHPKFVFSYGKHAINGFSAAKKLLDTGMQSYLDAPLGPFVLHSLRHTFSTTMASLGQNPDFIDMCLAHTPRIAQGSQGNYNHYLYLIERRQVLNAWSDYISALLK